jgi:hypothetical protein
MIWTGVFSLAHQYFTDSFIASKSTLGYCPFLSNTGLWPQTTVEEQQTWNLSAVIATERGIKQPATGSMFQCNMVTSRPNLVPPLMPSGFTLGSWSNMAYGIMLDADRSDFGGQLQWILNGMTMIAGSGNSAALTLPSGGTFSCLMDKSKIGIEIFVLLASLVLVLVCLTAMDLSSLLR